MGGRLARDCFTLRRAPALEKMDAMMINLTPEQEQRIQAMITRGSFDTVEEVVDAALAAVEQWATLNFEGTQQELEALLAEGLASKEMSEEEFWASVNRRTDAMRVEYKAARLKKLPKDSAD
jgi:Arc/MetJ-type ribon-helix-helix transcriptional regulator